jgi:TonB family protein
MRLKVSNAVICSIAIHAVAVAVAATIWKAQPAGAGGPCALCVHLLPVEQGYETTALLPDDDATEQSEPDVEPVIDLPPEPPDSVISGVEAVPDAPLVFEPLPVPAISNAAPVAPSQNARNAATKRSAKTAARVVAGAAAGQIGGSAPATPPRLTFAAPPVYPDVIEARGIGGSVLVEFTVDTRGRVSAAKVARTSGQAALDAAALSAVRRYRFAPALAEGRPVEWFFEKRITFRPGRG